jgi:Thioredoxin
VLSDIIQNSPSLSLSEYEQIVEGVLLQNSTKDYEAKMHSYILKNREVEQNIQSNITLNKRFFNRLLKVENLTIGLITEAWCLDACVILPLLRGIIAVNPEIEIKIFLRDNNEELMNEYLTNGSKSIPILFGIDSSNQEIFRWGPRSANAKATLEPVKDAEYSIKYQVLSSFYLSDLTMDIQNELVDLI